MNKAYFECKCESPEHIIRFNYDPEDNELYISVFLHQYRGFLKRVWVAIRYIFGYKCKFGHWDCTLFKNEDIKDLLKMVREVENVAFWRSIEKCTKEDTHVKTNNNGDN